MKFQLPKNMRSAKEEVDILDGSNTNHLSVSLPIPRTKFREEFIALAKELKEKIGLAPTPERVVHPKHNLKIGKNGVLSGEVETELDVDDSDVQRIDLTKKAETVYEAVKKPNFKKGVNRQPVESDVGLIKDELESEDKQPKEAVACEDAWTILNRKEKSWIDSKDRASIRGKTPSKARQKYLLGLLGNEGAAEESAAVEDTETEEIRYYVYKCYEDGSLLNTAYADVYQAGKDYSEAKEPSALIVKIDDEGFRILESRDLNDSQNKDIEAAVAILNEDGNEEVADVAKEDLEKPLFTAKSSKLGAPIGEEEILLESSSKESSGFYGEFSEEARKQARKVRGRWKDFMISQKAYIYGATGRAVVFSIREKDVVLYHNYLKSLEEFKDVPEDIWESLLTADKRVVLGWGSSVTEEVSKYKLKEENLRKVVKEEVARSSFAIKLLPEGLFVEDEKGKEMIFDTDKAAADYVNGLGLLSEDYEIVERGSQAAEESYVWYALCATESDKTKLNKIKITAEEAVSEKEVKRHLENEYGKNAVYNVSKEEIAF